jgi:hypothetical protein
MAVVTMRVAATDIERPSDKRNAGSPVSVRSAASDGASTGIRATPSDSAASALASGSVRGPSDEPEKTSSNRDHDGSTRRRTKPRGTGAASSARVRPACAHSGSANSTALTSARPPIILLTAR